jgi:hypothetical protein
MLLLDVTNNLTVQQLYICFFLEKSKKPEDSSALSENIFVYFVVVSVYAAIAKKYTICHRHPQPQFTTRAKR